MADSFLFYDLETFGQDPRRTRIAQFAGIRFLPGVINKITAVGFGGGNQVLSITQCSNF